MTRTKFHSLALWAIAFLYAILGADYYTFRTIGVITAVASALVALTLTPSLINLLAADCIEFPENRTIDIFCGALFVLPLLQTTSVVLPGVALRLMRLNYPDVQALWAQFLFNVLVAVLISFGAVKLASLRGRPTAVAYGVAMIVAFYLFEIFF